MARYFFDVTNFDFWPDTEGSELPSLFDARVESVRLSGELLRDQAEQFWQGPEWRVDVKDAAGLVLFSLTIMVTEAPAGGRLTH